jgi:hypothetical protein
MKRNKIDELFKKGIEDFSPEPSSAAWGKIEEGLQKKRKIVYWRWAGIAASFLLIGLTVSLLFISKDQGLVSETVKGQDTTIAKSELEEAAAINYDTDIYKDASLVANNEEQETSDAEVHAEMESLDKSKDRAISEQPVLVTNIENNGDLEDKPEIVPGEEILITEAEAVDQLNEAANEGESSIEIDESQFVAQQSEVQQEEKVPIRIVYKKGNSSPMLAKKDKNIVKRGFAKIGKITDDMKFSDETKARWRSTKENILAFNIEELFRENNEEQEELEQ